MLRLLGLPDPLSRPGGGGGIAAREVLDPDGGVIQQGAHVLGEAVVLAGLLRVVWCGVMIGNGMVVGWALLCLPTLRTNAHPPG